MQVSMRTPSRTVYGQRGGGGWCSLLTLHNESSAALACPVPCMSPIALIQQHKRGTEHAERDGSLCHMRRT